MSRGWIEIARDVLGGVSVDHRDQIVLVGELHSLDAKSRERTGILDSDDHEISIGDKIRFSYGIPPVVVRNAPVVIQKGIIYVLTPEHNPKKARLTVLEELVGNFYKELDAKELNSGDMLASGGPSGTMKMRT